MVLEDFIFHQNMMSQEDPKTLRDIEADVDKKDSEEDSARSLDEKSDSKKSGEGELKVGLGIELFFFFIGTNILFSYNTFLNGADYYQQLFPERDIGMELTRVLVISSELCNLFSLPFIERFTLKQRLYVSMTMMAIVQLIVYLYVNISTPKYYVVYILAFFTSMAQSVMFGSSMGFSGLFGEKTSAMANTGVALGGLITSILRMISKFILKGKSQGWFYLAFSVIMNTSAAIGFHLFNQTEICKERIKLAQTSNDFLFRIRRIKNVFLKIWVIVLVALMNMAITLCFFPGYAFYVGDNHKLGDWYMTIIIFSFMIGDFVGRLIARWISWPSAKYVWVPHVCRLSFILLYVLPIENVIPALKDDIFIDIVTFFLALTGGYFGGLCITYTATCEKFEKEEIDLGVFTTVVATNLGVLTGVCLTFLTALHKQ